MRHRGWMLAGAALAAAVAVVAVVVIHRPQQPTPPAALPTCAEIYAWPGVSDAARTAFADTWQFRERDEPGQPTMTDCTLNASFPVFDWGARPPGAPHSRLLILVLSRSRPGADTGERIMCGPTRETSAPVDEPGLGEDAYGCWAADDFGGYQNLHRYLHVHTGGLSLMLTFSGADYGPLDDPAVAAGLRADLQRNARCIIEAVVSGLGGDVEQRGKCGDAGRDV
ncbi:hypothetical protein H7J77_10210 [Mycolicibacillus parakoreensis]|uniref:DUF3558 domain-containing protein n=1 Tax=Mycolicibacillus parakoreensis TaxID=1069221 RepID=A0ABY3U1I9_9MYCO|nr:hypothetical protein [Mycolicibacillus parakoreensis]MCV7315913.1 hypothetical protein [Mycolicibacillus parakoreensis]ULN52455.1 hypothetical protein MIU77_16700 [Mycolicibacillus parakoreensis]